MSQFGEQRNFRSGSVTFTFVPHVNEGAFDLAQPHSRIDNVMCKNRSDGKRTTTDDAFLCVLPYAEAFVGRPYSEWLKISSPSTNHDQDALQLGTFTDTTPNARRAIVDGLRNIADLIENGGAIIGGGIAINDLDATITLDGNITVAKALTAPSD